jgi:hypothetical protein
MRLLVLYAVLLLTLGASCGPKVRSFVLSPRNVCQGGETRITWEVSGTPKLLVRHGRVTEAGSNEPDTLTLLLIVTKGRDSVTALEDILEFPTRFDHTVAIETTREGDEVVGRDTANAALWPASFVIQSVRSPSGQRIAVHHGERSVTLAADGSPSTALQGTPLAGAWELRSSAGPGNAPDLLRVNAIVSCVP